MKILVIGLGGFIGAVSRYYLQMAIIKLFSGPFPLGTFMVNILGCFVIGIVYSLAEESRVSDIQRLFFSIGFCGSFTTFSTFSAENLKLLEQGNYLPLSLYVVLSVILGVLAVYLGIVAVRTLG